MQVPDYLKPVIDGIDPSRLYSPREYAEKIGSTPGAVHRDRWRHPDRGPKWVMIGGGLRASGASIIKAIIESATAPRQRKKQPRHGGAFARAEAA